MAGFDDIARKANDLLKSEKTQEALRSEKAEGISDKILDGAAGLAGKVTGGKHDDAIEKARKAADDRIGTEGADRGHGERRTDGHRPTH